MSFSVQTRLIDPFPGSIVVMDVHFFLSLLLHFTSISLFLFRDVAHPLISSTWNLFFLYPFYTLTVFYFSLTAANEMVVNFKIVQQVNGEYIISVGFS